MSKIIKIYSTIPVLALGMLAFIGLYGLSTVRADGLDSYPSVIQKIAERFNLNEDDVQLVFDEHREERHVMMREQKEERLNQAVENGTITQDQKDLMTQHFKEMQAQMEELKNLDSKEQMEAIRALRDEAREWMETNDLDMSVFGGIKGRGFGHHGGFGHHY